MNSDAKVPKGKTKSNTNVLKSKPKSKPKSKTAEDVQNEELELIKYMEEIADKEKQLKNFYVRIGTEYFFKGYTLTAKKEKVPVLTKWKSSIINSDYGIVKYWKLLVPKYIGFVNVPINGKGYKRDIGGNDQPFQYYNLYEEINHKPLPGNYEKTLLFLKHIFGNYIDVALDYITILYRYPTQNLPSLCLVSRERKTGKSTFLKWLGFIFGGNSIRVGNEDLTGNFNSHWVSKLIIGVDESFIEQQQTLEKIKRLVTDDTILIENKGKDKWAIDFYGKFILLSNNETNFVQIPTEENRFFVIKVPHIEDEDPQLLDTLQSEIPAFLNWIETRSIVYENKSRLWFEPSVYETEALRKVVVSSRSKVEKAMLNYFNEVYDHLDELKGNEAKNIPVYVTPKLLAKEIQSELKNYSGLHYEVEKVLKENWNLEPQDPARKTFHQIVSEYSDVEKTNESRLKYSKELGRWYEISAQFIETKINKLPIVVNTVTL